MNFIRPMLATAVLALMPGMATAQRLIDRFEPRAPALTQSYQQPSPSQASGGATASVLSGIALGALTGAVAAIPITTYEVASCAECMFVGLAVPVFAAGGAVLGGIAGAAVYDGDGYLTARRRALDEGHRDNRRSREEDTGIGATLGMLGGLVATAALSYALADRWGGDDPTDSNEPDHAGEAFVIGLIAPASTIAGAIIGARIDASGSDVLPVADD